MGVLILLFLPLDRRAYYHGEPYSVVRLQTLSDRAKRRPQSRAAAIWHAMNRRGECERFHNTVSELDFDWYLRSV